MTNIGAEVVGKLVTSSEKSPQGVVVLTPVNLVGAIVKSVEAFWVPIVNEPVEKMFPPATRRLPVVMARPLDEARPEATSPPENVEVAADVFVIEPPEMERPPVASSRAAEIPPVKVDVAAEVLRIEPSVTVRPFVERSPAADTPPTKVEVAVPRTAIVFVATRSAIVVVAVMTALPTTASGVPGDEVPTPIFPPPVKTIEPPVTVRPPEAERLVMVRPARVDVAPPLKLMEPPVTVRPADDASPPPETVSPESVNVEVAADVERMDPAVMRMPADEDRPAVAMPP